MASFSSSQQGLTSGRPIQADQVYSKSVPAHPSVQVDQPKILVKGAISGHPDYLKLPVLQGKMGFDFQVSSL